MGPATGAATPTSASTASAEPICGDTIPHGEIPAQWCISIPGHRGRHAYRPTSDPKVSAWLRAKTHAAFEEMKEEASLDPTKPIAVIEHEPEPPSPMEVLDTVIGRRGHEPGEGPEAIKAHADGLIERMKAAWQPDEDDFINLKGKLYLPARRRIQWMREQHPNWMIDTELIDHQVGKRTGPGRVEGGWALLKARIADENGALIATGYKTEYSENFADYLEKAETGAIARALAVAGFGTEMAIDLDEGVEEGRIADSPVEPKSVKLGPSAVPGVGRGGKTDTASVAQIRRLSEISRQLALGPEGLVLAIATVLDVKAPELPADEASQNRILTGWLAQQSASDLGKLIASLEVAAENMEDGDSA